MALINENIKQNLANNLVANYDDSGVGTGINGQPLNVDTDGNLLVNVNGGAIGGIMIAQDELTNQVNVNADSLGQLNLGGTLVEPINDNGDSYSVGEEYATLADAITGATNLRMNLLQNISNNGYSHFYGLTENIFSHGGKVNVIITAYVL